MTEKQSISELLESIKTVTGLTQEQIADRIGYERPYLSQAKKRPSDKLKNVLLKEFHVELENLTLQEPDINTYKRQTKTATSNKHQEQDLTENQNLYMRIMKKFEKFQPIPVFDVDIAASNLELYDDKSAIPEDFYYIPEFSGCRAFNVYSDSMEPLIPKGSRIFARKIDDWQMVLEFGQVYAVGLNDGRRFIKYIKRADDKTNFKLVSENDFYDDFDVPKDKIRSVWLIDGWMNKHTQSTFFVLKQPKK